MTTYVAAQTESRAGLRSVFIVIGAALFIALSGTIALPLAFTPVPLVLQSHVCLLMGAVLGRRLGTYAVALFLFMGAVGLPVFALGGAGLSILLGPRGGYLVGYLLATWVTGMIVERRQLASPRLKVLAMGIGNGVIFACGLPQLALFIGAAKVFLLGMLPFLAGDLLKLFICYRVLKRT